MAWLIRRVARRRCYSVRSWLQAVPRVAGASDHLLDTKASQRAWKPLVTMSVYGDLPIGVRLAFYSSRSVKIVRCVNVAFDYPGSGGGFSIQYRIGTADVSRAPRVFAANTTHGRGSGAAADAA